MTLRRRSYMAESAEKFVKGSFEIPGYMRGTQTVSGYVLGHIGLSKIGKSPGVWRIYHIPTGSSVGNDHDYLAAAKKFARFVAEVVPNTTDKGKLRKAIAKHADALKSTR